VSVRPLELAPPDRVAQTSLVLDATGRRLAALHGPEDRTAVPLAKVSRWMRLAVVDTEDARFWRHGGVDWLAVARAAARDLERGAGGRGRVDHHPAVRQEHLGVG
jgi:penicillin-binding protein 1A